MNIEDGLYFFHSFQNKRCSFSAFENYDGTFNKNSELIVKIVKII